MRPHRRARRRDERARKARAGEAALGTQAFDLAALLVELASGMHEGDDRGVRVETRGTDRPVMVTGDRTRLAAALRALMHAAVRERGEPGVIVVECSVPADTHAAISRSSRSAMKRPRSALRGRRARAAAVRRMARRPRPRAAGWPPRHRAAGRRALVRRRRSLESGRRCGCRCGRQRSEENQRTQHTCASSSPSGF